MKKLQILVCLITFILSSCSNDSVAPQASRFPVSIGGTANEEGWSVVQTDDGGYALLGTTESYGNGGMDLYLVRLNAGGDTLWTRTYGGAGNDAGFSLQKTADGGFICAGQTASFSMGGYDVYLVRTNAAGDTLWTRTFGGSSDDIAHAVKVTSDGGYIVAGFPAKCAVAWIIRPLCHST